MSWWGLASVNVNLWPGETSKNPTFPIMLEKRWLPEWWTCQLLWLWWCSSHTYFHSSQLCGVLLTNSSIGDSEELILDQYFRVSMLLLMLVQCKNTLSILHMLSYNKCYCYKWHFCAESQNRCFFSHATAVHFCLPSNCSHYRRWSESICVLQETGPCVWWRSAVAMMWNHGSQEEQWKQQPLCCLSDGRH